MNAKRKLDKTKTKPLGNLTDTLRRAIAESELSLYAIAQGSGIDRASLTRFRDGERSLRLDKADLLAAYFGFELKPVKRKDA